MKIQNSNFVCWELCRDIIELNQFLFLFIEIHFTFPNTWCQSQKWSKMSKKFMRHGKTRLRRL